MQTRRRGPKTNAEAGKDDITARHTLRLTEAEMDFVKGLYEAQDEFRTFNKFLRHHILEKLGHNHKKANVKI